MTGTPQPERLVMTTDPGELMRCRVVGTPAEQGSKTGYPVKLKSGKMRAIVADLNPDKLKPWREAVRSHVAAYLGEDWEPFLGPVAVRLCFALRKPASAPKTRRTWPIKARSGDIDKLARAVLDALKDAGFYGDDAQVVRLIAEKDYPGGANMMMTPGVLIIAHRWPDHPPTPPRGLFI